MITLLTCTGDRPHLFARLERWMARQSVRWDRWLVVDDGQERTYPNQALCGPNQQHYWLTPPHEPDPRKSFATNMRQGLSLLAECIRDDFLFVIEDDDWYGPDYLASLLPHLMTHDLVGESHARYYNVEHRCYREMHNAGHASLCSTAFRGSLIPKILPLISERSPFLDLRMWRQLPCSKHLQQTRHCVGLKGQGGRPGLGSGHRPNGSYTPDPDGEKLREWIGDDATEVLNCEATDTG